MVEKVALTTRSVEPLTKEDYRTIYLS